MKKVRVLSIDGGGIRGVIPATVLQYVEEKYAEISGNKHARIADLFDIIVGTSTGGILSCFYLVPNPNKAEGLPSSKYNASEALDFYAEKGIDIFNKSKKTGWGVVRQLFNATQYSPKALEKIFNEEFGKLKMSELLQRCVVTTYDMKKKRAFFFNSREGDSKQRDFLVKDVVRSTSAAPTYFPPAMIKNTHGNEEFVNIDGGVFANNPSLCAYAECRNNTFPQSPNEPPSAKQMLMLSIGTGGGGFELPDLNKSKSWSVLKWAKSIPEIMMDGSLDTVDYQMKKMFGTLEQEHKANYKRIDVPLNARKYNSDMADASAKNINDLKKAGLATLKSAQESNDGHSLDKFIELLHENRP